MAAAWPSRSKTVFERNANPAPYPYIAVIVVYYIIAIVETFIYGFMQICILQDGTSMITAFLNQKGGVGKTTLSYRVTVRIRAKMGNSGSDYQQAANFSHKIMVVRTLTKKTILLPLR